MDINKKHYLAQTLTSKCRFLLELFWVDEDQSVSEGCVPELCDEGADVLPPVEEQDTEQGGQQGQQLIIIGQGGTRLQAAQHINQELLQLEERGHDHPDKRIG